MMHTLPDPLKRRVVEQWHLHHAFDDPMPNYLIDPAMAALAAVAAGDYAREIVLPEGIVLNGKERFTATELVTWLHLESLLAPHTRVESEG